LSLTIPDGVEAQVMLPSPGEGGTPLVNGRESTERIHQLANGEHTLATITD
jgi:hypothetical protein